MNRLNYNCASCLCLHGKDKDNFTPILFFLLCYFINLLAPELFFLILAHPVYKMWIIKEPNTLDLWNKLHFEEEKTESIYHV